MHALPHRTDVVVVGTGAAGLTAALTAAAAGLRVTILEKAPVIGGTTVVSGGSIWAPANRWLAEAGVPDSRDDAVTYLRRLALGRVPDRLIETFVDQVNPMLDLVVKHTGLEFTPNLEHPDYQPDLPGARPGGRTLQSDLFDATQLGELRGKLRPPHSTVPVTKLELDRWGMDTLDRWDWALIAERTAKGVVGMGAALVGELLHGCLRLGATVHTEARALRLHRTGTGTGTGDGGGGGAGGGRIEAITVATPQGTVRVAVDRGVVLASGGFEWAPDMVGQFLGVPMDAPASPPANVGDGLRMVMEIGAALANMNEAWWGPMVYAAGDTYDGQPLYRPTSGLRALPGGIIVNRRGRRFADEAMNYNDLGKAMAQFDAIHYEYANLPCWLVFDDRFRSSYSVATVTPDSPTPGWMATAPTLRELADTVGIDPDGLREQVAEFNRHAEHGQDPRFGRGTTVYDRYRGDPSVTPHRNLRPLGAGPYYAVRLHLGCLGTKGGPLCDEHGQVQGVDGAPITGLYACGNVAASPFGPGYPGAGATLAAGMTYGFLSGRALAGG
ncbi:FAD-dependent oxidoreductase [Solwaraspora sp. WMMB335]|uniref:FAD-dependent oxidoreductase n=1 Tax=Solwaraspora sp. WMMB335 TaxID=3404118 RepID=UPI003B941C8B